MVQSVCHLELRLKSYGYINNVSTFLPLSTFMEVGSMENVGGKLISVENKLTSG
jgi:hypothetical protein